jgi:hypothetical protein
MALIELTTLFQFFASTCQAKNRRKLTEGEGSVQLTSSLS